MTFTREAQLFRGDAREVLRNLPERSVYCCVTSPPYFGLRDYKLPPTVWGGAAGCRHEWGREAQKSVGRTDGGRDIGGRGGNYQRDGPHQAGVGTGSLCALCEAWRGCLGLEPSVGLYVAHLVEVFREVRRVLVDGGTLWLNLGDSYAGGGNGSRDADRWPKQSRNNDGDRIQHAKKGTGIAAKNLLGVPWRAAFALQDDGWILRQEIIWSKSAPMPESVKDRPSRSHETIFLFSKAPRYWYDADAVREKSDWCAPDGTPLDSWGRPIRRKVDGNGETARGGTGRSQSLGANVKDGKRNLRSVWDIRPDPNPDAHFASWPREIPRRAILAGCPSGGTVLDPFMGSGRTGEVALGLGRSFVGIDLSQVYLTTIAAPAIAAALAQDVIGEERSGLGMTVTAQESLFREEAGPHALPFPAEAKR